MKAFGIKNTDKETLKQWYYLMSLGRKLDERAPNYLKQALGWSYHAPYAGHDGIQLAIGQVFQKSNDHLFPYYRDMLTAISAGVTAEEIILNGISKASDAASGGRHMSQNPPGIFTMSLRQPAITHFMQQELPGPLKNTTSRL
jgi:2-oxoisovalerate dehydrogenase E1 component